MNKSHNKSLQRTGRSAAALRVSFFGQPLSSNVVEDASRLDNTADEENPLIVRRKAPHNQRIEQTPFGRSSSAVLSLSKNSKPVVLRFVSS
jgi:hypothetical protein